MKFTYATIVLSLLSTSALANPIADANAAPAPVPAANPAAAPLDARSLVTCQVTTANAASQKCVRVNTNQCPVDAHYALGASVTISCYTNGDVVGNTSMWFLLYGKNDYIPAYYVQNCFGMNPC